MIFIFKDEFLEHLGLEAIFPDLDLRLLDEFRHIAESLDTTDWLNHFGDQEITTTMD
jgi:hypothetical protein